MCGGTLSPPRACARASSRVARKNQRAGRAWLRDVGRRCVHWSRDVSLGDRPLRRALVARLGRRTCKLLRYWSGACRARWPGVAAWMRHCPCAGRRTSAHDGACERRSLLSAVRRARLPCDFSCGAATGRPPLRRSSDDVVTADFF
ncbi:hypothetical protein F511_45018 [Dorcoceras hygrometricum]|uniref:Uncharacterized protein n=1 Tax=Dorcoceras hygrometricum TaxID=472368 RepID=A0A2Z7A4T2_9LAMI|nr:hypothetical protein F511_45018 [Dorcoceras hygrometricum]